jgi:DNA polymerase-3 subunit alpha
MLGGGQDAAREDELPPAEPWPVGQDLSAEKELLGFYVSGHPLAAHEAALKRYSLVDFKGLLALPSGTATRVGGLVTGFTKRFTKKTQEPMGTFKLETLDGSVEVVVFPDAFRDYGVLLRDEAAVLVGGSFRKDDDQPKFEANEVYLMQDAHKHLVEKVSLHLPHARCEDEKFREFKNIMRRHPGETPVVICIEYPSGEKIFIDTDRAFKVAADESFVRDVTHLLGEHSCYVQVNPAALLRPRRKRWEARETSGGFAR